VTAAAKLALTIAAVLLTLGQPARAQPADYPNRTVTV
jgi:hypothetical protein